MPMVSPAGPTVSASMILDPFLPSTGASPGETRRITLTPVVWCIAAQTLSMAAAGSMRIVKNRGGRSLLLRDAVEIVRAIDPIDGAMGPPGRARRVRRRWPHRGWPADPCRFTPHPPGRDDDRGASSRSQTFGGRCRAGPGRPRHEWRWERAGRSRSRGTSCVPVSMFLPAHAGPPAQDKPRPVDPSDRSGWSHPFPTYAAGTSIQPHSMHAVNGCIVAKRNHFVGAIRGSGGD